MRNGSMGQFTRQESMNARSTLGEMMALRNEN